MYIEEVILEGFKSYATRTVISGWDPEFNAITGLNGSGKSNILDAICFVLGIDNLRQIRANNLQDLVYKRGAAGINKATVTVVFNNEDRSNSPLGFQDCKQIVIARQIVLGGKNIYKLNGIIVPQNRLENLYQSVQLNVNHPHFLIMQGRITKVLNMKPVEILGLIEETAGTRMYEDRKDKALSSLTKKEMKLNEISTILKENIEPYLNKLKDEKEHYLAYQTKKAEQEKMERMVIAYAYYQHQAKVKALASELESKSTEQRNMGAFIEDKAAELNDMSLGMQKLMLQKRKFDVKGSSDPLYQRAQETNHRLSNKLTELQSRQAIIKAQAKELDDSIAELEQETKARNGKSRTASKMDREALLKAFSKAKEGYEDKKAELSKLEDLLNGLVSGISKSGEQVGYTKLIQEEKITMSNLSAELNTAKSRKSRIEEELKMLHPKVKEWEAAVDKLKRTLDSEHSHVAELKDKIGKLSYGFDSQENDLASKKSHIEGQVDLLKREIDSLYSDVSFSEFCHHDIGSPFHPSQVKGYVAQYVHIDDAKLDWCDALEICAGGKLYNVIVDNEKVGSALLDQGGLRKRITIIPLNKIQPYAFSAEKLSRIEQVGKAKAQIALSFVTYDHDLAPAMQYVFGSTLLCSNKETAAAVAFEKSTSVKCITKDGDVYDPSGTMTGGASNVKASGLLATLNMVNKKKKTLNDLVQSLEDIGLKMHQMAQTKDKINLLEQEIESKSTSMHILTQKLKVDYAAQKLKECSDLADEVTKLESHAFDLEKKTMLCHAHIAQYTVEFERFGQNGPAQLSFVSTSIAKLKKEVPALQKAYFEIKESKENMESAEEDEMDSQRQKETELNSKKTCLKELLHDAKELDLEIKSLTIELDKSSQALEKEKANILQTDTEMTKLDAEIKAMENEIDAKKILKKKVDFEVVQVSEDLAGVQKMQSELSDKHLWIEHEKHKFNVKHSEYDFKAIKIDAIRKISSEIKDYLVSNSGKVNHEVIETMDSYQKKEAHLKGHLVTVKSDKVKIENTLETLNVHKREALEKTWTKVNKDFGEIFQELLPGSYAQLVSVENGTIEDGIEIKVRLGNVWKKSLNELSGGQRSLIALSLILSLLQFKPAPMYILDEIDAALDLSHTQNIGKLFKSKFKGSQFIIVSLKDGLFNNANVLFKTKFAEGISVVERHENKHHSHAPPAKAKGKGTTFRTELTHRTGGAAVKA